MDSIYMTQKVLVCGHRFRTGSKSNWYRPAGRVAIMRSFATQSSISSHEEVISSRVGSGIDLNPKIVTTPSQGAARGSDQRRSLSPATMRPPTLDAFLFPAIGVPRMFQLTTVPEAVVNPVTGRSRLINRPHPSLYVSISHNEDWQSKSWQTLSGMTADLPNPYVCHTELATIHQTNPTCTTRCLRSFVVFYPQRQQSGEPLPINQAIAEIQGTRQRSQQAWKGDIIVAKYESLASGTIIDMAPSDYVYIKNWFTFSYPEHPQI